MSDDVRYGVNHESGDVTYHLVELRTETRKGRKFVDFGILSSPHSRGEFSRGSVIKSFPQLFYSDVIKGFSNEDEENDSLDKDPVLQENPGDVARFGGRIREYSPEKLEMAVDVVRGKRNDESDKFEPQ